MALKEYNGSPFRDKTSSLRWNDCLKIIDLTNNLRNKAFFATLLCSGRRIGEVQMLKVGDISFEDREILWNIEKKEKVLNKETGEMEYQKEVKWLPDRALNLLKEHILKENLQPNDLVFYSSWNRDKALTRQRWKQILNRITEKNYIQTIGGKRPRIHDLRHSVGKHIMDTTGDIRDVQNVLAHSSISTSGHYAKMSTKETREKLEGAF